MLAFTSKCALDLGILIKEFNMHIYARLSKKNWLYEKRTTLFPVIGDIRTACFSRMMTLLELRALPHRDVPRLRGDSKKSVGCLRSLGVEISSLKIWWIICLHNWSMWRIHLRPLSIVNPKSFMCSPILLEILGYFVLLLFKVCGYNYEWCHLHKVMKYVVNVQGEHHRPQHILVVPQDSFSCHIYYEN